LREKITEIALPQYEFEGIIYGSSGRAAVRLLLSSQAFSGYVMG
jgi:hypothetical protein